MTNILLTLGVPLPYISNQTRCNDRCKSHGPTSTLKIPGNFGRYHATSAWHRAGSHQQSCKHGKHLHHRHGGANSLVSKLAKLAGAAADPSETMVSSTDNKRIDLVIWHQSISPRGIGIDTCIWNDYTLARLEPAANHIHYVLRAAELYKNEKYVKLCDTANLDFLPCAINVDGGFGPSLEALHHALWDAKAEDAKLKGVPTSAIKAQERRILEEFSTFMARQRHRSIYQNLTGHTADSFVMPTEADYDQAPFSDD